MRRMVWLGYLSLVLAVPLGVGFGRTVGHPGDPPHIFTLLALFLAAGAALMTFNMHWLDLAGFVSKVRR